MTRITWLAVTFTVIIGVSACGQSGSSLISDDDPALKGLPAAVVSERLADPKLRDALISDLPAERAGMAQLNVSSTIFCRDALKVYEDWTRTGASPAEPKIARPDAPEAGFDDFMDDFAAGFAATIASGDPDTMRSWLLLGGAGCHDTIADSANPDRTVADVLQGQ